MSEIYILMAAVRYEGSWPVRAYASVGAATRDLLIVQSYHSTAPEFPADCTGQELDEYMGKRDMWDEQHPAGPANAGCDEFFIKTVPLVVAAS